MSQIPIVHKSAIQKAYVRLKVLAFARDEAKKHADWDWPLLLKFSGPFFLFIGFFNSASADADTLENTLARVMVIGGLIAFIVGWKLTKDDYHHQSDLWSEDREIRNRLEEIKVFTYLDASEWAYEDRWNSFDPLSDDSYR